MLKAIARKAFRQDHWLFLSWYRNNFGTVPALRAYLRLRADGVGSAPNPLNGGVVWLRPGTTDQDVYDEIFIDKEYDFDMGDPGVIVDAGAHIGLATVFFASKYPQALVVCLEPEPSNFALLSRNVGSLRNVRAFQAGLWSRKAHLQIEDSTVPTWSFRVVESSSGEGIPAMGIEDVAAACGLQAIDVLKMDIEGSECEVLGQSSRWIDRVRMLIIELHDRFRPGCTESLQSAYSGHRFEESRSGESIVLRNIRRAA